MIIEGVSAKPRMMPPKEAKANTTLRPRPPNKGKTKDKATNQMSRQDTKYNPANKAKAKE